MSRPQVINSWLRSSNDIIFNCDREDLTGQLITTILPGSDRTKLGKFKQFGTIKLKNNSSVILTTKTLKKNSKEFEKSKALDVAIEPLLKSHLQKCVRRGKSRLAVKTAKHLLEINPIGLLRRLPIIMVEDVMLFPQLNSLMWLMMAYPYRGLITEDCEWILGLVNKITKFEFKEILYTEAPDTWTPDPLDPILGGLVMRIDYGGMRGDMEFLRHVVYTWHKRYNDADGCKLLQYKLQNPLDFVSPIDISKIKSLKKKEFLLAAIDFHIAPITSLLPKSILNPRQMIWDNSSSLNFRYRFDGSEEPKPYWTSDEEIIVHESQARLLEQMFPKDGFSNYANGM
jgi:hypothetical protein